MIPQPPVLLALSSMARRLRVTAKWLRAEADAGRIPCVRGDGVYLFDPDTVERVLLERARKPADLAEALRKAAETAPEPAKSWLLALAGEGAVAEEVGAG